MSPIPSAVARLSDEQLTELADNPKFVLPIYGLVLIPLALYVYHDIVDKRWRQISVIFRYFVLYISLYVVTATALVTYIVIQWRYGTDYKEVGAGTLTLVVGIHRLWTLIRLIRILQGHAKLVQVLQICNRKMSDLAIEMGQFRDISYYLFEQPPEGVRRRHLAISASLFDDDYPGDSARISWLKKKVRVHPDDINECVARIAIWMRAVIRSTDVRIWDLLTGSRFVGFQTRGRNLYDTLLGVVLEKSTPITPGNLCENPAERLLNHPREDQLRHIGIGVVWWAARMRAEEISQVVSEMPASWMNDTLLSGKELMFEMGVCLMFAGMEIPSAFLGKMCVGDKGDIEDEAFWSNVDVLFAQAVSGLLCLDWGSDSEEDDDNDKCAAATSTEYERLIDDVQRGLPRLRAELKLNDHEERFLRYRMQHLITAAYYGGYVVGGVLGEHASHIYLPGNMVEYPLYQAELVFVLYEFLLDVGWCDGEKVSQRQMDNNRKGNWVMCNAQDRGACPGGAFRSFVMDAGEAARNIAMAFKSPYTVKPAVFKDDETRRLWLLG